MGAYVLFILVFTWVWLMLFVKRFHDLNRSGWNILLWILPLIGQFIYLINIIECFFMKGVEPNRFSNDPNQAPVALPASPGARRGRTITQLALVVLGVAMIFVVYYLLTDRVMFLPAISRAATRVAGPVQSEVATAGPLASIKSTHASQTAGLYPHAYFLTLCQRPSAACAMRPVLLARAGIWSAWDSRAGRPILALTCRSAIAM